MYNLKNIVFGKHHNHQKRLSTILNVELQAEKYHTLLLISLACLP